MADTIRGRGPQPIAPDSPEGRERAMLAEAVRQFDLAVDAVYANAVSIARLVGLAPDDVSRLCVMAACRIAERQIEKYVDAKRADAAGEREFSPQLKARVEEEIRNTCIMLADTLSNGLLATREIAKTAEQELPVQ